MASCPQESISVPAQYIVGGALSWVQAPGQVRPCVAEEDTVQCFLTGFNFGPQVQARALPTSDARPCRIPQGGGAPLLGPPPPLGDIRESVWTPP